MKTSCVVGLYDPSLDQVFDGFTLSSFLRINHFTCQARYFLPGARKPEAAAELLSASETLVFLVAGPENLHWVQVLASQIRPGRKVFLLGREFSDAELRAQVLDTHVDGVLVGEPFSTARALARRLLSRGPDEPMPALSGLYRPHKPFQPREPYGDLNVFPPADYGHNEGLAAFALPLHASRGYPFPCVVSARGAWEVPLRTQRPDRVVADMALYVDSHQARHFIFTDRVANARTAMLLDAARGIIGRGLSVRWHATVWPDPLLDRAAIRTLRRSGCRSLRMDLFSGSEKLNRALHTGVSPAIARQIVEDCFDEGVRVGIRLWVGFPGEQQEDRTVTLLWLAENADCIFELAEAGACHIRAGAAIRRDQGLHFPAQQGSGQWHDGGVNNQSKRQTWLRELRRWADDLGLWQGEGPRTAARANDPVLARLQAQVSDAALCAGDRWKRRHLLAAGVLHGREAFCGPDVLYLDLVGMEIEAARRVLREAAATGTRRVVLGRHGGEDVLAQEGLGQVLGLARDLRLHIALQTPLIAADPEGVRRVAAAVQEFRLVWRGQEDGERIKRWAPVVAQYRASEDLPLPRVTVTAHLGRQSGCLKGLVQDMASWGVDRLAVRLLRSGEERLDRPQREEAIQALQALLREDAAALRPTRQDPAAVTEALFPAVNGWPPGFVLDLSGEDDAPACTCPAGIRVTDIRRHPADSSAWYLFFAKDRCMGCELLPGCPLDRAGLFVRLPMMTLERPDVLLADLQDVDCGLGRAAEEVDSHSCLVGWDEARVTAQGDLHICSSCGVDGVGNVLENSFEVLWYSRDLNEFRRMSLGASMALPYVERRDCSHCCHRAQRNRDLLAELAGLHREERGLLQQCGAGDRLKAPACDPVPDEDEP